jgi:hypothetical protein
MEIGPGNGSLCEARLETGIHWDNAASPDITINQHKVHNQHSVG